MTSQAMTSYMRIGELANVVGLSPDTIRYYERVDLLPPPARTPSGYRIYSTQAVDRLRFILSRASEFCPGAVLRPAR